jgi:copper transport protein
VFVLPRATADDAERRAVVRRFSTVAFVSVVVLGVSGLLRALTELGSVSQIWSSGYGRALIVKTALFLPLLGIGWLNRTMLLGVFARLRRSAIVEVTVILGIVVAVAVLTELRPGIAHSKASQASAPLQAAGPATLPPRDAVVDAHALGRLAVAVARTPGTATVTILGIDGTGASGRSVLIDGARANACGSGCYRTHAGAGAGPVTVSVDGRQSRFDLPATAPDATARVRRATAAYQAAHSVVFDETLSAGVGSSVTRFTAVRPNRLAYETKGGASAIVIGARRWDRESSKSPFVESAQTPLDVTQPYWTSISNAHLIAPNVVTFLDRSLPAWFRLTLGPTLPRQMHMTAAAHFMTDRYVEFGGPATVSPPSR